MIIIYEHKVYEGTHENIDIVLSYDMFRNSTPNSDGLHVVVGWLGLYHSKLKFDKPMYIKLVSTIEYTSHGNGD